MCEPLKARSSLEFPLISVSLLSESEACGFNEVMKLKASLVTELVPSDVRR